MLFIFFSKAHHRGRTEFTKDGGTAARSPQATRQGDEAEQEMLVGIVYLVVIVSPGPSTIAIQL